MEEKKTMKNCPYCAEEILFDAIKCKHCGELLGDSRNKETLKNADKRTLEFILGLIGGILGILVAYFVLFFGNVGETFDLIAFGDIKKLGMTTLLFSIYGIIGAVIVRFNGKQGGWIMVTSAVGGVISSSLFYLIPGILLLIPGVMGIRKRIQIGKQFKAAIWISINVIVLILLFALIFVDLGIEMNNDSISLNSEIYYIGDTVEVGNLSYKVKKAYQTKEIKSIFTPEIAKGTYLIIEVTVKNNDKNSRTIDTSLFKLADSNGRIYDPDTSATIELQDFDFFLTTLNPGLEISGFIAFDVPTIEDMYILKVSESMLPDQEKQIKLMIENKTSESNNTSQPIETPNEDIHNKEVYTVNQTSKIDKFTQVNNQSLGVFLDAVNETIPNHWNHVTSSNFDEVVLYDNTNNDHYVSIYIYTEGEAGNHLIDCKEVSVENIRENFYGEGSTYCNFITKQGLYALYVLKKNEGMTTILLYVTEKDTYDTYLIVEEFYDDSVEINDYDVIKNIVL